jgi:hypothetical protein
MAVLLFSTSTVAEITFNDPQTRNDLSIAIAEMEYFGGSTWTQKALEDAYEQVKKVFIF